MRRQSLAGPEPSYGDWLNCFSAIQASHHLNKLGSQMFKNKPLASTKDKSALPVVKRRDPMDPNGDERIQPHLPHEADQSASNQHTDTEENARMGRQAKADIDRGLVDTDRARLMDKLYQEEFKPERRQLSTPKRRS